MIKKVWKEIWNDRSRKLKFRNRHRDEVKTFGVSVVEVVVGGVILALILSGDKKQPGYPLKRAKNGGFTFFVFFLTLEGIGTVTVWVLSAIIEPISPLLEVRPVF